MKQETVLLGMLSDKIAQCDNQNVMTATSFLDLSQRTAAEAFCRKQKAVRYEFYGGYRDAERVVAVFLPYYIDISEEKDIVDYFAQDREGCPLALIKATVQKGSRVLTHRDYLGSLLALGIKRDVIGDILVSERETYIFVMREMAEFLLLNYNKAGHTNLTLTEVPIEELVAFEPQTERVTDMVSSLRLDNIVASAFGLSRTKAGEAIRSGLVFVNSLEETKPDSRLKEKDKLVLRGYGKIVLDEIGGRSRKDKIYLTYKRYL